MSKMHCILSEFSLHKSSKTSFCIMTSCPAKFGLLCRLQIIRQTPLTMINRTRNFSSAPLRLLRPSFCSDTEFLSSKRCAHDRLVPPLTQDSLSAAAHAFLASNRIDWVEFSRVPNQLWPAFRRTESGICIFTLVNVSSLLFFRPVFA